MKENGLTTLEILIVTTISGILLVALLRFLVIGFPLQKVTYLQQRSTETARIALKRLALQLRQLKDSDTGAYPLVEAEPQRIVFYSDTNGDGVTERIRYELQGTDLERGVVLPSGAPLTYNLAAEAVTTVAVRIQNGGEAIFTYYGGNYPEDDTPLTPADLTEVKYIQFRLVVDYDPMQEPDAIDVVSQVQLRNLKTNLGEVEP